MNLPRATDIKAGRRGHPEKEKPDKEHTPSRCHGFANHNRRFHIGSCCARGTVRGRKTPVSVKSERVGEHYSSRANKLRHNRNLEHRFVREGGQSYEPILCRPVLKTRDMHGWVTNTYEFRNVRFRCLFLGRRGVSAGRALNWLTDKK